MEDEYTFFPADFRPKIFTKYSQIVVYGIPVFECIWGLDSVEVILEPVCRHLSLIWQK